MARFGAQRRLRPFAFALALTAVCAGAPVRADVYDRLSGTFGSAEVEGLRCHENPHTITFTSDRSRAHFRWQSAIIDYLGGLRTEGTYLVRSGSEDGVVMQITDEQRRQRDGQPVVWVMRPLAEPEGYCWGRTDWPAGQCTDRFVRCTTEAPVS